MKIRFKKKRLYISLGLGLVWVGFGIFNILDDDNLRWMDFGYLIIGALYIGHFLYDINTQYLTIENGSIRKNILYGNGKKIELEEIKWIKKFAGDYTLKTETKELKINTELIEEESLAALNRVLEDLNIPSGNNIVSLNQSR